MRGKQGLSGGDPIKTRSKRGSKQGLQKGGWGVRLVQSECCPCKVVDKEGGKKEEEEKGRAAWYSGGI